MGIYSDNEKIQNAKSKSLPLDFLISRKINKQALKFLSSIFSQHDVLFAYLFGSQAENNLTKLSDVDIAIYFQKNVSSKDRFNKKLTIMTELSSYLKRDDIDIVVLNEAYPLLEHRIIKQGIIIYSSDEKVRIDYEVKAVMRYLDFKPYIEKYTKEVLYG